MDPNDLIDSIVDAIDYAELAHDQQGLIKARRLLNNELRQAIDIYIQDEVNRVLERMTDPGSQLIQERLSSEPVSIETFEVS